MEPTLAFWIRFVRFLVLIDVSTPLKTLTWLQEGGPKPEILNFRFRSSESENRSFKFAMPPLLEVPSLNLSAKK